MCAWLHIFPSTKITYILTSHTHFFRAVLQNWEDISQAIVSILSPPTKDLTQNCCVQFFPPSLTHVRDMCKPRSPYFHMWLEMKRVSVITHFFSFFPCTASVSTYSWLSQAQYLGYLLIRWRCMDNSQVSQECNYTAGVPWGVLKPAQCMNVNQWDRWAVKIISWWMWNMCEW